MDTGNKTQFDEVYEVFLASIDSYDLAKLDDDELSDTLKSYLLSGVEVFDTYIDKEFTDYDTQNSCFNFKLNRREINILAKAMKLEWVRLKKHSQELMEKAYGDRDYSAIQGYRYLEELQLMEVQLSKEIKNEINTIEYANSDLYGDMA
ncbi:hypothetical protein [Limosilactobacillus reuteri]|uniref:hypothetical protein n=1 Tax=Limosilactobacillus reuteri TaxID=1598 RepID=UPI001E49C4D1|nr:hypothetical protein [Limosilactobacillus reuteri]MCC4466847.1 hypothetical protein [Limosilactobacillus reuteri]MCC4472907.1 hypothetical protein [Limosilactobacillus reuteri]